MIRLARQTGLSKLCQKEIMSLWPGLQDHLRATLRKTGSIDHSQYVSNKITTMQSLLGPQTFLYLLRENHSNISIQISSLKDEDDQEHHMERPRSKQVVAGSFSQSNRSFSLSVKGNIL